MAFQLSIFPALIGGGLVLASCVVPVDSDVDLGSRGDAFHTAAAGAHDHADMTAAALWFLKPELAEEIGDLNESTDSGATKKKSPYHADNCRVGEAFEVINTLSVQAAAAADPSAPQWQVLKSSFATWLHTAQDFYAHSNWVEAALMYEGVSPSLVTSNPFRWPSARPGERVGATVVLGDGMPKSWQVTRPDGSRVPIVFDGTQSRAGLMTGTYDNEDPSICPVSVAIPHGPVFNFEWAWDDPDEYLAKDAPTSVFHDEALALARDQTVEEFCRLQRLVLLQHGAPAQAAFLDEWLTNPSDADEVCPDTRSTVAGLLLTVL